MNKDQRQISIAVVIAAGFIWVAACIVLLVAEFNTAAVRQNSIEPQALEFNLSAAKSSRTTTQEILESNKADSQSRKLDPANLGSGQKIADIDLLPTVPEKTSRVLPVTTSRTLSDEVK